VADSLVHRLGHGDVDLEDAVVVLGGKVLDEDITLGEAGSNALRERVYRMLSSFSLTSCRPRW
jgi:hypothetical protein